MTGLDLLATDLVVLSACHTARGQVRTGEGVLGLRSAFAQAGAKSLIMSLWKVDDSVTKGLMVDFYRRLDEGVPPPEALRQAQLVVRADKCSDPHYWGAFVCQGDPSPIARVRPSKALRLWRWLTRSLLRLG